MSDSGRLKGKKTIVTGGGRGIGAAIAGRLAREGADVAVADIIVENASGTVDKIKESGGEAIAVPVDVSDVSDIRRMVRRVVEEYGRIDILVNNAGVIKNKHFLEVTEEDWDRVIDINQRGTAFCTQTVALQMIAQIPEEVRDAGASNNGNGKIVNLSSISGRRGRELLLAYAASKAAIISITQSAAIALAPYNINVNAIAPSVVMTEMWEQNAIEKSAILGIPPEQTSQDFVDRIPLGRPGTPEEMAGAVAFLCSEDSDYITGQTLNVDGGYEMD